MPDMPDFRLSRRRLLQAMSAAAAQTAAPGNALALAKNLVGSVSALPDIFQECAAMSTVAIFNSSSNPEHAVAGFKSLLGRVGHILRLSPAMRQQLTRDDFIRSFFEIDEDDDKDLIVRSTDPTIICDNQRLTELVFDEWKRLIASPKTFPPALVNRWGWGSGQEPELFDVASIRNWPCNIPGHPPTVPSWWQRLGDLDKLKVRIEAEYAQEFGAPLGHFLDDDKLLDVLRDNWQMRVPGSFPPKYAGPGAIRVKNTMEECVNIFGHDSGPKEFLRTREWFYRVEGLSPADAKAKAKNDLATEGVPPIVRVERSSFQSGFTLVDYTARFTRSHGKEADLRHLVMLYHHLSAHLEVDNTSFFLRWRDNGFNITVPKDSKAHQALEKFCTECFSWNAEWFSEHPYGLEPDYVRRHYERVDTPNGPKIVTHISGPGSDDWNSNVLNRHYVPYVWQHLRFHL